MKVPVANPLDIVEVDKQEKKLVAIELAIICSHSI